MQPVLTHIPIIFDKSHLLTIGERLYSTSLDLVRELVSNAYDADATTVRITVQPGTITVEDNGSGMNEAQLRQYFTIGSREKRIHTISQVYKRKRIGEFGIGKFSVLTIAERFLIDTQDATTQFHASLLFDTQEWNRDPHNWHIPCNILPYDPPRGSGTRVSITKMKKMLEPIQIIRAVRERFPLGKTDFHIFVNGSEVTATSIPGKRFPVHFETPFGSVQGEVILAILPSTQQNVIDAGITIRVKEIAITKSMFGFETSHAIGTNRIRGSINADFLPITSSRNDLIQDCDEYQMVYEKMRIILRGVLREVKNLAFQRENARASEALREALDKMGRAFKKNPGLFEKDSIDPPIGYQAKRTTKQEEGYYISKAQFVDAGPSPFISNSEQTQDTPEQRPPIKRRHAILANRAIIRKMHFRNLGLVCRMERYGPGFPPSFREQGIIFINIDHPLYNKQMNNSTLLTMFISGLIAKEVALEKHPHDATEAYALHYKLLTDAFKDIKQL